MGQGPGPEPETTLLLGDLAAVSASYLQSGGVNSTPFSEGEINEKLSDLLTIL